MSRILLLLLLGFVVWLLLKRISAHKRHRTPDSRDADRGTEPILACKLCGLHVPQSEGTTRDGVFYCCEAHSRQPNEHGRD